MTGRKSLKKTPKNVFSNTGTSYLQIKNTLLKLKSACFYNGS